MWLHFVAEVEQGTTICTTFKSRVIKRMPGNVRTSSIMAKRIILS